MQIYLQVRWSSPLKFSCANIGALVATAPSTRWGYFTLNQADRDPMFRKIFKIITKVAKFYSNHLLRTTLENTYIESLWKLSFKLAWIWTSKSDKFLVLWQKIILVFYILNKVGQVCKCLLTAEKLQVVHTQISL